LKLSWPTWKRPIWYRKFRESGDRIMRINAGDSRG
jgi:hypothetical protein